MIILKKILKENWDLFQLQINNNIIHQIGWVINMQMFI